jgi:hypothetical protein
VKYLFLLIIAMLSLAPWLAKADEQSPAEYSAQQESYAEVAGRTALGAAEGCVAGGALLGGLAEMSGPKDTRGMAGIGCKYGALALGGTALYLNAARADEIPTQDELDQDQAYQDDQPAGIEQPNEEE